MPDRQNLQAPSTNRETYSVWNSPSSKPERSRHYLTNPTTMALDLVAALGARLEARLRAQETRIRTFEDTVRTHVQANGPAHFALPDGLLHFPNEPVRTKGDVLSGAATPAPNSEFDIGATFRRKGMLSDVPMAVSRAEHGLVYANFTDSEGLHEMAFEPNQIELVESALSSAVQATVSAHVTASVVAPTISSAPAPVSAIAVDPGVVNTTTPASANTLDSSSAKAPVPVSANTVAASIARAMAPVAAMTVAESIARAMAPAVLNTPITANASGPATASTLASVSANVSANVAAPVIANRATTPAASTATAPTASVASLRANTTASITLPDGTQQFAFAPTGGDNLSRPAAYTPPVPANFGEGATFRRRGVLAETPMTVNRVGNGIIYANYTDSEGTREIAFYPNQLDLVTAAP